MNRSNVGNITTNAVQTMSISGTTVAGMRRAIDRADMALNAQGARIAKDKAQIAKLESDTARKQAQTDIEKEKLKQAQLKTEQMKLKNESTAVRTERTKQLIEKDKPVSIDTLLDDNSEQVPHIKTYVNNNMEWQHYRNQLITSATKEDFDKALSEWRKTYASKNV